MNMSWRPERRKESVLHLLTIITCLLFLLFFFVHRFGFDADSWLHEQNDPSECRWETLNRSVQRSDVEKQRNTLTDASTSIVLMLLLCFGFRTDMCIVRVIRNQAFHAQDNIKTRGDLQNMHLINICAPSESNFGVASSSRSWGITQKFISADLTRGYNIQYSFHSAILHIMELNMLWIWVVIVTTSTKN